MIARHPDNVLLWCCVARYAESDAHRERALQRAQSLDPQHPLVILQQVDNLISEEDFVGARRLLRELLDRNHTYLVVYRTLLDVEYQLGNYDSAAEYAHQVAALDPEDNEPLRTLYTIYDTMGKQDQAAAYLKSYVEKHRMGAAAAYLTLARQSWEQEKPDLAQDFLEQAVRSKSRRPEDHMQIASLMMDKLEDRDRAMDHIELAIQHGSTDATAHFVLATTKEEKGEVARAIELYERSIQLAPNLGQAHVRLGMILTKLDRIEEARAHFTAAERLGVSISSALGDSPAAAKRED
jgi:Tfp pilus assembly protein PilF